jgi:hypothetical protein
MPQPLSMTVNVVHKVIAHLKVDVDSCRSRLDRVVHEF